MIGYNIITPEMLLRWRRKKEISRRIYDVEQELLSNNILSPRDKKRLKAKATRLAKSYWKERRIGAVGYSNQDTNR